MASKNGIATNQEKPEEGQETKVVQEKDAKLAAPDANKVNDSSKAKGDTTKNSISNIR